MINKCLEDEGPFYAADIVLTVLNYSDIHVVCFEFDIFVFRHLFLFHHACCFD